MRKCLGLSLLVAALVSFNVFAVDGLYEATWASVKTHNPAPDWFRDAKFGIYFHWGVYSVPAFGSEWYPRNMHREGSREYKHHLAEYGPPSKFGYHDFVPMFKAEHFDPEAWAELFEKAGARFAGPVAEHHDGFAMWASKLTPWNAKDRGPQRDIAGELAEAIRAHGMRFVTSFHHARNNQHQIEKNGKLEWTGHYPRVDGWPTVSDDPELRMLYGNLSREEFLRLWQGKLVEVIDRYQPDIMWFDSWLDEIPEENQLAYLAYYFNQERAGEKAVVVTCKQRDLPLDVAVEDFEKGRTDHITEYPFLTDDTISYGSWCYTQNLKIKPTADVLHVLIDIVSKNGQLLLNISPKADGTIPEDQRAVLLDIGKWLGQFGEAIYETRPFVCFGEGPTQLGKAGHFVKATIKYGPKDVRYTRRGDTVYAIVLGWPGAGTGLELTAFGREGAAKDIGVAKVTMLGADDAVEWTRTDSGLSITCPATKTDDMAVVFRLDTQGLGPAL